MDAALLIQKMPISFFQVEGLVDLLQKEPGPFKSPPMSPPDGKSFEVKSLISFRNGKWHEAAFQHGFW